MGPSFRGFRRKGDGKSLAGTDKSERYRSETPARRQRFDLEVHGGGPRRSVVSVRGGSNQGFVASTCQGSELIGLCRPNLAR